MREVMGLAFGGCSSGGHCGGGCSGRRGGSGASCTFLPTRSPLACSCGGVLGWGMVGGVGVGTLYLFSSPLCPPQFTWTNADSAVGLSAVAAWTIHSHIFFASSPSQLSLSPTPLHIH